MLMAGCVGGLEAETEGEGRGAVFSLSRVMSDVCVGLFWVGLVWGWSGVRLVWVCLR